MVILVDLDEDDTDSHGYQASETAAGRVVLDDHDEVRSPSAEARPNPNINGFSSAVACYPYADLVSTSRF